MLELGLISLAVAAVLMLVEAHASTGGLIAVVAAVALVGGVALALSGTTAGLPVVLAVSGVVSVASVSGLALLVRSTGSVRRVRPRSGTEAMVGHLGVMRTGESGSLVFVDGGLWRARPSPLGDENEMHDGDRVVVDHVKGLTLFVRKAEELELYS